MAENRPSNLNSQQQIRGAVPTMLRGGPNAAFRIPQPGLTGQPIIYAANIHRTTHHPALTTPRPMFCVPSAQRRVNEEHLRQQSREHNYHVQQQRLRSFNASSVQKNLNPDTLIESMFGKQTVAKQRSPTPPSPPVAIIPPSPSPPTATSSKSSSGVRNETQVPANLAETTESLKTSQPNNAKNLEEMLLECSDLTKPRQAHTFPKTVHKNEKNSASQRNKLVSPGLTITKALPASNESDIKLGENTVESKTNNLGFPDWCFVDAHIPDLYRQVQRAITRQNALDTDRLYPILVSSGLNRDILGHIWSLVNQTTPGQLLPHELYAALTLIALAQNGYKFSNLDILQSLARPLVPYLKQVMVAQPPLVSHPEAQDFGGEPNATGCGSRTDSAQSPNSAGDAQQEEFTEFFGFTPTVQKSTIGNSAVGNRLANYGVGLSNESTRDQSSSSNIENRTKIDSQSEDFADFQNAPSFEASDENFGTLREKSTENGRQQSTATFSQPTFKHDDQPNKVDDKYSIFRELDRQRHASESSDNAEDEFGEFLCVNDPKPSVEITSLPPAVPETKNNADGVHSTVPSFTLKSFGEKSVDSFIQSSLSEFQLTSFDTNKAISPGDDPEFGAFLSTNDMAEEFISLSLKSVRKDHSGSVESQSVASLEFGPLDTGFPGGDNVSNLSRQASSHSLDFKVNLPENDDELSLTQSSCDQKDRGVVNSREFALDDPYRFVHGHARSDIERNVYEWERCLESCCQLIQGANAILSDITSASVFDEIVNSDEGINYLISIVEVYRVASRLQLSIKTSGVGNDSLDKLIKDIDTAWANLYSFLVGSSIMPSQEALDFSDGTLKADPENNGNACGVCLLDVNVSGKSRTKSESDGCCLEFSGRQYHATCANFWVNCVNSMLPALTLQQRLLY